MRACNSDPRRSYERTTYMLLNHHTTIPIHVRVLRQINVLRQLQTIFPQPPDIAPGTGLVSFALPFLRQIEIEPRPTDGKGREG